MKRFLFALLLAAPAAAEPPVREGPAGDACAANAPDVEDKALRVRVTRTGEPGQELHQASLFYTRCQVETMEDAGIPTGGAVLHFSGSDVNGGAVAARLTVDAFGSVSVELRYGGGFGVGSGVSHIGNFPRRTARTAFSVAKVSVYDIEAGRSRPLGDVEIAMTPRRPVTPAPCP